MIMTRRAGQLQLQQRTHFHIPEIDSSMLSGPFLNGEKQGSYGSFGVVKLELYRGIFVAVKELLQRSVKEDTCRPLSSLLTVPVQYMYKL